MNKTIMVILVMIIFGIVTSTNGLAEDTVMPSTSNDKLSPQSEAAKIPGEAPPIEKLIAEGKFVDALELLDASETKDSNDALRLRGIILFKMGDYANALANFERYREATKSDTQELILYTGICEMKTGRFDEAVKHLESAKSGTDDEFAAHANRSLGQIVEEKAKWRKYAFDIFAGTQYDSNVLLVPTNSPTSAGSLSGVFGGSAKLRPLIRHDSRIEAEYRLFLGYHLTNRKDSAGNSLAAAADILANNFSILGEKKRPIAGMPATIQATATFGLAHLNLNPYLRTLGLNASTKLVENKSTMSQISLGWSNNYCYFDQRSDNTIIANLAQSYIFANGHLIKGSVALESNISDSAFFAYTSNGLIADYIFALSAPGINVVVNAGATSLTYRTARQDTLYQLGLMGSKEVAKINLSVGIGQFYNKSSDTTYQYARTILSFFVSKNF